MADLPAGEPLVYEDRNVEKGTAYSYRARSYVKRSFWKLNGKYSAEVQVDAG